VKKHGNHGSANHRKMGRCFNQYSLQVTTILQIRFALQAGMWFSSMQRAIKKLRASPFHIHLMQALKKLIKEMVAIFFFVLHLKIDLIAVDISGSCCLQ
jgi:hypothetical protein